MGRCPPQPQSLGAGTKRRGVWRRCCRRGLVGAWCGVSCTLGMGVLIPCVGFWWRHETPGSAATVSILLLCDASCGVSCAWGSVATLLAGLRLSCQLQRRLPSQLAQPGSGFCLDDATSRGWSGAARLLAQPGLGFFHSPEQPRRRVFQSPALAMSVPCPLRPSATGPCVAPRLGLSTDSRR